MDKEPVNIFVPHFHGDSDYLPKLRKLIEKQGYEVRDSSIDERNPNDAKDTEYIKSLLRPQIDWAGKVIVMIGPQTHTRWWVDWEIEYASSFENKRIVGVFLPGATDADVPANLNKYGDALVSWNSDSLSAAIDGDNIWLNPEGGIRQGVWPTHKSVC